MCQILYKKLRELCGYHKILSLILMFKLTRVDDSIDENVSRYQTIVVFVHFAEQVREARFFVVHELQELSGGKNLIELYFLTLFKVNLGFRYFFQKNLSKSICVRTFRNTFMK